MFSERFPTNGGATTVTFITYVLLSELSMPSVVTFRSTPFVVAVHVIDVMLLTA